MEFFNLLADAGVPFFSETHSIQLDFIGKFIKWLVSIAGSVGFGIILFSLALKLVTLPFDVYQRITMRKQNVKMKQNQEKMEKLQKQYANNKELYNQKVMEMYKESGISVFSSCLPMILSMVIFFIAIGAFNSFAAYSNVKNYNTLVSAYNTTLEEYALQADEVQNDGDFSYVYNEEENIVVYTVKGYRENDYLYYTVSRNIADGEVYSYDFNEAIEYVKKGNKNYFVHTEKVNANAEITAWVNAKIVELKEADLDLTDSEAYEDAVVMYFTEKAQTAVKASYEENVKNETDFFWIKNIWVTDASYKNPVMGYSDFSTQVTERETCSCSANTKVKGVPAYTQEGYELITAKLGAEKKQANGYFILIALSIGTILLQQFLSMRAQKEQQKYSSVDGQGASQQKMMLVMMTGMFAIFSFMYSSAFSIYLIVSNLFSMLSMFVINKLVDTSENRKQTAKEQERQMSHTAKRIEEAKNAGKQAAQKTRGTANEPKKKK